MKHDACLHSHSVAVSRDDPAWLAAALPYRAALRRSSRPHSLSAITWRTATRARTHAGVSAPAWTMTAVAERTATTYSSVVGAYEAAGHTKSRPEVSRAPPRRSAPMTTPSPPCADSGAHLTSSSPPTMPRHGAPSHPKGSIRQIRGRCQRPPQHPAPTCISRLPSPSGRFSSSLQFNRHEFLRTLIPLGEHLPSESTAAVHCAAIPGAVGYADPWVWGDEVLRYQVVRLTSHLWWSSCRAPSRESVARAAVRRRGRQTAFSGVRAVDTTQIGRRLHPTGTRDRRRGVRPPPRHCTPRAHTRTLAPPRRGAAGSPGARVLAHRESSTRVDGPERRRL